jgi:hypothetical protein
MENRPSVKAKVQKRSYQEFNFFELLQELKFMMRQL